MAKQFQEDLLKDEKILWAGQPDTKVLFALADFFLVPFSFLWGCFAIFWKATTLYAATASPKTDGAAFVWTFPIFGIPFVLVGLYFIKL